MINEQAVRYGIPFNGRTVDLTAVVKALHDFLAANVLLTETLEGYAHRLRTIGHLHEAEDESQEFGDLYTARAIVAGPSPRPSAP